MASQNKMSLSDDINDELKSKLAEQQQLRQKALELEEFVKSLQGRVPELKLLSSSAQKSRGLRDLEETLTPEQEMREHEAELDAIRGRIIVLQQAITLLSQQGN
ncbi:uncharacterized protein BDCG_06688 [Blastomyces dermatitidis ER-3]|uniref:Uncharacterized protein n=2 Tax=Ajellomyces dermatitidis TaxID=5039 RepID=F2TMF8_AJEDA|nr:uncharacterized protein BDCG_06688 [Blastomyces dermatitidis ER-3]EEQ91568.1 hypothetical protein BDCG_06688 [Blastomyces dermatitidis ER-3]EGE84421.1 hypothetical protein BDDG_07366 [Blastomyces dermatitidis ATCC 18188]EQL33847.1 hypothetical protein BDFG_04230 [Blastomyces dermatitidis ATCC 26199]